MCMQWFLRCWQYVILGVRVMTARQIDGKAEIAERRQENSGNEGEQRLPGPARSIVFHRTGSAGLFIACGGWQQYLELYVQSQRREMFGIGTEADLGNKEVSRTCRSARLELKSNEMQSINKKAGAFGKGADICTATSDTYLMPFDVIFHMTAKAFFSTSLIFLSPEVPDKGCICINSSNLQGHGPARVFQSHPLVRMPAYNLYLHGGQWAGIPAQ